MNTTSTDFLGIEHRVKLFCKARGITLAELSEKIGMSRSGLFQTMRKQTMTLKTIEEISRVLDVDVQVLLGWFNVASRGNSILYFDGIIDDLSLLIEKSIGKHSNVIKESTDRLKALYSNLVNYTKSLEELIISQNKEISFDRILKSELDLLSDERGKPRNEKEKPGTSESTT